MAAEPVWRNGLPLIIQDSEGNWLPAWAEPEDCDSCCAPAPCPECESCEECLESIAGILVVIDGTEDVNCIQDFPDDECYCEMNLYQVNGAYACTTFSGGSWYAYFPPKLIGDGNCGDVTCREYYTECRVTPICSGFPSRIAYTIHFGGYTTSDDGSGEVVGLCSLGPGRPCDLIAAGQMYNGLVGSAGDIAWEDACHDGDSLVTNGEDVFTSPVGCDGVPFGASSCTVSLL